MKITNKYNLPEALYMAASAYTRKPDNKRFSVTELTTPPLMRTLRMRHWDNLTEDASGRLWAVLGQATHAILAHHGSDVLVEEKMVYAIPELEGIELSGMADLLDSNMTLSDWKITSVYSFLLGDKPEWEHQLNSYAFLYAMEGFEIKRLLIHAILRDWQQSKSLQQADYPPIPFQTVNMPLWSQADQLSFIVDKITAHLNDSERPCTDAERWYQGDTWAVIKEGRKSAIRVLDTKAAAENFICQMELDNKHSVVRREGRYNRCVNYCNVRQFCPMMRKGVV